MKTSYDEGRTNEGWFAHSVDNKRAAIRRRRGLILLIAMAVFATCTASHAQILKGSTGAGWQTWSVTPISPSQPNLNDNGAPWWDLQWNAASTNSQYGSGFADKNPGFCITATGDCVGVGSGALVPGPIPFWGMPYDSVNDTGGARDNTVYFQSTTGPLIAILALNSSANADEINEFGWFETDSAGSVVKARHSLFMGTGSDHNLIPDPVGKIAIFTPTKYFGYYYSDVSEHTDATATVPRHGCYVYSIFALTEPRCMEVPGGQGDHDFVIFSKNPTSAHPTFWIAGEDPADCATNDGDCNLTLVSVTKP